MQVFCTTHFYDQITDLTKKKNYANLIKDICDYFSDKNIVELHQTKDILMHAPGIYSLNKYRIPNSSIGSGKSGSYRCICACRVQEDKIYLDFIYPKTGSEGIDNLKKEAYKDIAKNITASIIVGKIYEINLPERKFELVKQKATAKVK